MKKYIIIVIVITSFSNCIISCKKHKIDEPVIITPRNIEGKWIWIYSALDYPNPQNTGPYLLTPINTGTTESMVFSSGNLWKQIVNNITADSGTYFLEHHDLDDGYGNFYRYDQINYNRNGSILGADYYQIHNDTLTFNPGFRGYYTSQNVPFVGGSKWFIKQ